MLEVTLNCKICTATHIIEVPVSGYLKWQQRRAAIQDALPTLSAEDREMLMSGICPACWDKLFGE